MKLAIAAVQRSSGLFEIPANLESADSQISEAIQAGAELIVLPELFNTGYARRRDYIPHAEEAEEGATWRFLRARSREKRVWIAAGFAERFAGHVYNALGFAGPNGQFHIYRKRNLVLWESTQFRRGTDPVVVSTPFGRVGFLICADMLFDKVWAEYRKRIDLAIVISAWPEFTNRKTKRPHWLLGRLGSLCGVIPGRASADLGVPVIFANQCGDTETTVPVFLQRIPDRFAGVSAIHDAVHGQAIVAGLEPETLLSEVVIHQRGMKGTQSCDITSHLGSPESLSVSE